MEFKLHSLFLGATILCLSSVNGQIIQPSYTYYGQQQAFQPYFYNPIPRQTVTITASDPSVLQTLRGMDQQELQKVVNEHVSPYLEVYNVPSDTVYDVKLQNGQARKESVFYPSHLPIKQPVFTNIRPTTLVYTGPYGLNAVSFGGIGRLGPSLVGRNAEYYEIGRPKTRSVDSGCVKESTCSRDNVPSSSSLKSSAKVADSHEINVRDNDNSQGNRKEGNFQNPNDLDKNEITDQIVAAVKSEILYLLRDMDKDGSQNYRKSNFSIDTAGLKKILQKYTSTSRYFSDMEGSYRNQSINPPRPVAPFVNNYDNNGWNPRSGDLNSNNYNSWWTNSYNYPNNNGRNWNIDYNYQSMNNGQFGNPIYNYQPMNNGQFGNPIYNYQPMNNGQFGYPNYNHQSMFNSKTFQNSMSKTPHITGIPGNPNYDVPPMDNTERPENANNSVPSMDNNRQAGNLTSNPHPVNNTGRPGNPNYNRPPTNPDKPGVLYPNQEPFMNSERPDSTNQYPQNNPKSTINFPPNNNIGTSGYSMNRGYQVPPRALNPNVEYSQGQFVFNGNLPPNDQYQMPAMTSFKSSPQIHNPYEWYTRAKYS